MFLSPIPSQPQPIRADTVFQKDLSAENKRRLTIDETLQHEQKPLHQRKISKILTLAKPEGYFTVGEQYKISLMSDYLHGNTQHFSDEDWLYLIIKMGKRVISEKKLEKLKQEFSTADKEILFNKIARLQALRYKIEDRLHHSHRVSREKLYDAAKTSKYLFSTESLEDIIESAKNSHPLQSCAPPELLFAKASLNYEGHNPYFSELIIACYKNSHFLPPDIEIGHKIEDEIKKQNPKISTNEEDLEIELMLSDEATVEKKCGERSFQFTLPDNRTLYFKYQRKGEPWDEFTRELKIHNALHNLFSDQDFASEIPFSKGLFSVPVSENNYKLEISEGRLHGYLFTASQDYVNYASQLDSSDTKNPHGRSEEGLKKAAIDIGTYARYGLTFDSLIKVQHDKYRPRKGYPVWTTMGALSNVFCKNADSFPGSICNWVRDTECSDLSWSGLRDLGDSQIFGNILPSLSSRNTLNTKFFPEVGNLLAYFNALMDNIIAIVIVYARGKRLNPEFHYKNPLAVEDVKTFVREVLEHFLCGYYSTKTISLQKNLGLDDTGFEQWLNRVALEIVYWLAMQPYEMNGAFYHSKHAHKKHNYFAHVMRIKRPDPEIMETSGEIERRLLCDNSNVIDGNHNLGLAHNCSFPLQALIKGLCKLSINILEQQSPVTDQNPRGN
ncbi:MULTISPECIES: hypothetical protein [unclassified Endozoicomonas]|uniref:hypothetical protein n=1 Tax=unclassified Endozoicomonas TaxID=2644528 RepID=UPI00214737A5|nr:MULTISPECIES: hypothetical protein [unclassified Endozoicomonas]